MAEDNGDQRVSMSVVVLRAETRAANAELELRLKTYIGDQLQPLRASQQAVDRGDFTQAASRAIVSLIDRSFHQRAQAGFTRRERRVALIGLLTAAVSMGSAVFLSIHTLLG